MVASSSVILEDRRASTEPEPLGPLSERLPLGSFVAYNGTTDDGQRRRAIVVGYGDDGEVLELLDGPETITISENEQLTDVIVLATSADAYAQRVSVKSRVLGRAHGWCEVAEAAIEELNTTPANGDVEQLPDIHVVATRVTHLVLRPRHNRGHRMTKTNVLDTLRSHFFWEYMEANPDYFTEQKGSDKNVVTKLEVVDVFPTTGDVEPTTEVDDRPGDAGVQRQRTRR